MYFSSIKRKDKVLFQTTPAKKINFFLFEKKNLMNFINNKINELHQRELKKEMSGEIDSIHTERGRLLSPPI